MRGCCISTVTLYKFGFDKRGHRTVKIKVLKLLSPVTPNPEFPEELRYLVSASEAEPREGAFLRRGQPLWQMVLDGEGVDSARREGFGALFANLGLPPLRTSKALRPKLPGDKELERKEKLGERAGDYAIHGGGWPVRVKGVEGVVGVIVVSGLKQEEDHQVIVEVLGEIGKKQKERA